MDGFSDEQRLAYDWRGRNSNRPIRVQKAGKPVLSLDHCSIAVGKFFCAGDGTEFSRKGI